MISYTESKGINSADVHTQDSSQSDPGEAVTVAAKQGPLEDTNIQECINDIQKRLPYFKDHTTPAKLSNKSRHFRSIELTIEREHYTGREEFIHQQKEEDYQNKISIVKDFIDKKPGNKDSTATRPCKPTEAIAEHNLNLAPVSADIPDG